jgi:hypothetical protein
MNQTGFGIDDIKLDFQPCPEKGNFFKDFIIF